MKKLLSILVLMFLLGGISFATNDAADPPKKSYSSGKEEPKAVPDKNDDDKPPPKKSFGSGTSKPKDTTVTPPKTGPPIKSFGSGSNKTGKDIGTKPKSTFDSSAGNDQKKVDSKIAFTKGNTPAPTYVSPKGKTIEIDPKDTKIKHLRSQLSEEKWHNRELREHNFYSSYYSRPIVVYNDPYSSLFWYWMLDRSIEQQAFWAYNHRYSMDQQRYNDLLSRNAELAARVHNLELQGHERDATYQPEGMVDSDLMYHEDYVKAAYNPQTKSEHINAGPVLIILLCVFLVFGIMALVVWLIFVKKW